MRLIAFFTCLLKCSARRITTPENALLCLEKRKMWINIDLIAMFNWRSDLSRSHPLLLRSAIFDLKKKTKISPTLTLVSQFDDIVCVLYIFIRNLSEMLNQKRYGIRSIAHFLCAMRRVFKKRRCTIPSNATNQTFVENELMFFFSLYWLPARE